MGQHCFTHHFAVKKKNLIVCCIVFSRMVTDCTAQMGSSGALSEDINNPCRETELKKMYEQLKNNSLPNYVTKIHRGPKKETKDKEEIIAFLKV